MSELSAQQLSRCSACEHRNWMLDNCKAFPQGIPQELLRSLVEHTKPYPGDHGIQYKAKYDDEDDEEAQEEIDPEVLKRIVDVEPPEISE